MRNKSLCTPNNHATQEILCTTIQEWSTGATLNLREILRALQATYVASCVLLIALPIQLSASWEQLIIAPGFRGQANQ